MPNWKRPCWSDMLDRNAVSLARQSLRGPQCRGVTWWHLSGALTVGHTQHLRFLLSHVSGAQSIYILRASATLPLKWVHSNNTISSGLRTNRKKVCQTCTFLSLIDSEDHWFQDASLFYTLARKTLPSKPWHSVLTTVLCHMRPPDPCLTFWFLSSTLR